MILRKKFARFIYVLVCCLCFVQTLSAQKKLDSLRKSLTKDPANRIKTLARISAEFQKFNVDSAWYYAKLILAEGQLTKDQKTIAMGYHVMGNVLSDQGKFKEALECDEKAEKIRLEIHDSLNLAKTYNNVGMMQSSLGNFTKALDYYNKACALKAALGDSVGLASSMTNVGLNYEKMGQFDLAINCYYKALKMGEQIKDNDMMGGALNNMGNVYLEELKYDDAMDYFKRSLEVKLKTGNKKNIGGAYTNIGHMYLEQGKFKEALNYLSKSEKLKKDVNDQVGLSVTYSNMGLAHKGMGEYAEAEQYYLMSVKIRQKIGERNGQAQALTGLAETYRRMGKTVKALAAANQALALALEIKAKLTLRDVYAEISACYADDHRTDKAYEYLSLSNQLRDTLLKEENQKQASELKARYESETQLKKITELTQQRKEDSLKEQAEQARSRANTLFLIAGIIVVLLTAVFLYLRNEGNKKANEKLSLAYSEIELKNKDITDSIRYAKRIQESILPERADIEKAFPESFVLYKPKDIVSGDFYWFSTVNGVRLLAVADCTGHGVPGAFMSLVGTDLLNHVAVDPEMSSPAKALTELDKRIKNLLKQRGTHLESADGMDTGFCAWYPETRKLQFSGAYRSMLHIRNGILTEYEGAKFSIGGHNIKGKVFFDHEFMLEPGDAFYLFSDGYADQFGGPGGKKFKTKPMKNLILSISSLSMKEQGKSLDEHIETWRGNLEQVDDICVIGVRV